MNDLLEQIKVEHLPGEKNEQGKEIIDSWLSPELF